MAEDDALKRNTDCVYFLASPLTCKKGSECEFRHSEYARNNPRDCRYWLNGNCLNANCPFRHPPLDGLVTPQAGNSAGPAPSVASSGPPVPLASQKAAKQAVPCIYFQGGFCLKGNLCPFLHGPIPSLYNKVQPVPATSVPTEVPTFKKKIVVPENSPQPQMNFPSNASNAVQAPRHTPASTAHNGAKARIMEKAPDMKRYLPPGKMKEAPTYKETAGPPVDNRSLRSRDARPHRAISDQNIQNGRDVRESSPGFDVLVDYKLREEVYFDNEDQYARKRGHEGRSSEFDMGRHDVYNSVADVDRNIYHSKRGYDSFDDIDARDQRGTSSGKAATHNRRGPYRSKSPDFVQNSSDLRHRLSKHRRGNGLESVVSPDYKPDYHPEDRGLQSYQRDTRRSPIRESSTGSRLQGRIKLLRSPPVSRLQQSSHQGRLRDRLGGRVQDKNYEERDFRGQMRIGSTVQANGDRFSGPKSLSEVRGSKCTDNEHQQLTVPQSVSGGKLRDSVLASSRGAESNVSFDGPKPLSEILKRKRNAVDFDPKEVTNHHENDAGNRVALSSSPEQKQGDVQDNNEAPIREEDEEDGEISNKKTKVIEDESSLPDDEKYPNVEEGLFGGDEEEHGVDEEAYDEGEEEYEYEQDGDVEGYDLNEADGVDNEDFMDEDDGDDFAKKLGVSF